MSRNRIELTGKLVDVPEIRSTPSGTPVMRFEVDCGEGRESLRLEVVMAGAAVRHLGRLRAGATVSVTGALRAARGHSGSGLAARGVEVVASGIREMAGGSNR
jgi:primosomal replication protein N